MCETWVWSLGWEDPLEEAMTTHSSILAWRIPMDRGAWWAPTQELNTTDQLSTNTTQTPMSSSPYSGCRTLGIPWRLVVRALCFHCRAHQIDTWSVRKLKFHMMHGLAKRKKKKSQYSFFNATFKHTWALLLVQMVKHLPAMRETWVQSLGWEYPLEKGMAAHYSILAWRIPWTEKPGGLQSMGSQRVIMTEQPTLKHT